MTGASTRLAVQSPRRLVRDALCAYLAGWPEFAVVGQTAELDALYALCALRQPDTVLVDADRLAVETVTELSRLLRALRVGGGTPHRAGPDGLALTERELEIVSLLGAGHTVPEIATLLEISPHTVENHKRRIYVKLGVGNQIHAVSRATSLGLLEPDPASRPPRRARIEPGRPPLVTVRGPAGRCLDDATEVLVEAGLPFVFTATPVLDDREHWLVWHRGPRPVLLIDPLPADWMFAEALDGPTIVVWSTQPDLGAVVDALLRGVRALVRPADVSTELAPIISLVSHGYVALPAMHFDELAQTLVGRLDERPGGVPELTGRERDILDSIARGHTVRQTARALGIAAKTVENTQARLFRKLGAHNRSAALTIAYRLGLVAPGGTGDAAVR